MKHTQGIWYEVGGNVYAPLGRATEVALCPRKEDAQRIAACVNAMAVIATCVDRTGHVIPCREEAFQHAMAELQRA